MTTQSSPDHKTRDHAAELAKFLAPILFYTQPAALVIAGISSHFFNDAVLEVFWMFWASIHALTSVLVCYVTKWHVNKGWDIGHIGYAAFIIIVTALKILELSAH